MLTYRLEERVAVIGLDDGKANAVSHGYVDALSAGLDRAEQEASAVLITGREKVFCAGFDLKEIGKGPAEKKALVDRGAALLLRLFTLSLPVVAASSGHAIAAGALVLLASDVRIGAAGESQYGLNETAIGMTLPPFGMQMALCRLGPQHQTAAILQSVLYGPDGALAAGYLDQVVLADELEAVALTHAAQLADLPREAFAQNKLRVRQQYIENIRDSLN